jgi:hypothetical protein
MGVDASWTDLVIVPGHGVCKQGCTAPAKVSADSSWVGIFRGEGPAYVEHAKAGVELAAAGQSLLVFSGGQTREAAGRRSEAVSYWEIARDHDWWGHGEVETRALKEEYARDSFENMLLSIALFRRETGRWPTHITVVGWRFKSKRYDLHRQAVKWPQAAFEYRGVNDPPGEALQAALVGEAAKTESVARDLYLVGSEWTAQRELRDPFQRRHPYRGIDGRLDAVFDFLDRTSHKGTFPW